VERYKKKIKRNRYTASNKQYALSCLRSNLKAVHALGVRKTAVASLGAVFSHPHSSPSQTCGLLIMWAGKTSVT